MNNAFQGQGTKWYLCLAQQFCLAKTSECADAVARTQWHSLRQLACSLECDLNDSGSGTRYILGLHAFGRTFELKNSYIWKGMCDYWFKFICFKEDNKIRKLC